MNYRLNKIAIILGQLFKMRGMATQLNIGMSKQGQVTGDGSGITGCIEHALWGSYEFLSTFGWAYHGWGYIWD